MGLAGSTQRIVTGFTFFFRRRRPCLCLAGSSVGAGCGVRAASHLAAGSFLHSSHRYVLSSSSGLMRRLQDLQGDVRPFLLRVMNWRPDVFMPHFPRTRVDHERDRPGCGVVNVPLHQDQVRALAMEVKTYEQIATELGYANRGTVYHVVSQALKTQTVEAVAQLRDMEVARLDMLQLGVWQKAMEGDVPSAAVAIRVIKERCRVLGLEGPRALGVEHGKPRTLVVHPAS
jgi:hypothetical protein